MPRNPLEIIGLGYELVARYRDNPHRLREFAIQLRKAQTLDHHPDITGSDNISVAINSAMTDIGDDGSLEQAIDDFLKAEENRRLSLQFDTEDATTKLLRQIDALNRQLSEAREDCHVREQLMLKNLYPELCNGHQHIKTFTGIIVISPSFNKTRKEVTQFVIYVEDGRAVKHYCVTGKYSIVDDKPAVSKVHSERINRIVSALRSGKIHPTHAKHITQGIHLDAIIGSVSPSAVCRSIAGYEFLNLTESKFGSYHARNIIPVIEPGVCLLFLNRIENHGGDRGTLIHLTVLTTPIDQLIPCDKIATNNS